MVPLLAGDTALQANLPAEHRLHASATGVVQSGQPCVASPLGHAGSWASQPPDQQQQPLAPGPAWPLTSPGELEAAATAANSSSPVLVTALGSPAGLAASRKSTPDGSKSLSQDGLPQVVDDPVAVAIEQVPETDGQALVAAAPLVKPELVRHAAVESSGLKPELREEPQAPRETLPATRPAPDLRPAPAQTAPQLSAMQPVLHRRGLGSSLQPASGTSEPASGIGFSELPAQLMQFSSRDFDVKPYTGLEFQELTAKLLEQASSARSSGDGVYQASLDLNPPSLGRMSVNIAVHGESVALQMAIASTVPKEQLRGSLQALQRSLEEAGLHVVELKVLTVDPDGQPPRQQQESAGGQPALSIEDEESLRLAFREALAAPVATTFTGSA